MDSNPARSRDGASPEQEARESSDGPRGIVRVARGVAWTVSTLGHPFVLVLAYVLAASLRELPAADALGITALVFAIGILPMLVYLGWLVRSGRSNFDVSIREQRRPVYRLGLVLGLVLIAVFFGLGAPPETFVALGLGLALVVVGSIINRRLKVSLHSAFAAWTAVAFACLDPRFTLPAALLALAVAVSRLVLRRHTPAEVTAGLLLGALLASPLLWF